MSVRVYPDNGPSYTHHEPTPGKGLAVCNACAFVRKGSLTKAQFCKAWTCAAVPEIVTRQDGVDPITGEVVPALVVRVRCKDRNPTGECSDFKPGAGAASTGEEPHPVVRRSGERSTAVTVLIAWLIGYLFGLAAGALVAMGGGTP